MGSVEPTNSAEDLERAVALVEETGERVSVTVDGEPAGVLLPAAELAELEHWAQRGAKAYGADMPRPDAAPEPPPGPARQGPYVRYVHADGVRMTFTRGRAVVAELRSAGELAWLELWARNGRQVYMSPKQAAAFAEFLARQPPTDERDRP
ncbi:type II toxin-antitoxin system Phd/YefM family antitoxin [Streptomyces sp. NBC_00989]|uniref:type II toxin-antitoxin system Phd/YefM family antitoxin n=1 Tax=Streptomyces sp. NBC_00989 TaxID=2903705 RepID=UPI0038706137|nr:type II toxin-antitoxin system Phd/YefM family antitoxin [Streptomyces sp. NBC_00989]